MKYPALLFLFSCLPGLFVLPAQADDTADLETFLQETRSLRSLFTQKLYDEKNQLLESGSGVLELLRPGRFRWEYREPYRQLIVADGEQIWVYDSDLEQVTLKSYDETLANTPALLLSGGQKINEIFNISELETQNGVRWFRLEPRSASAQFERIHIGLEQEQLSRLILFDKLGQAGIIEFKEQQRNIVLDEKIFSFTPPEDVDLIDGRDN